MMAAATAHSQPTEISAAGGYNNDNSGTGDFINSTMFLESPLFPDFQWDLNTIANFLRSDDERPTESDNTNMSRAVSSTAIEDLPFSSSMCSITHPFSPLDSVHTASLSPIGRPTSSINLVGDNTSSTTCSLEKIMSDCSDVDLSFMTEMNSAAPRKDVMLSRFSLASHSSSSLSTSTSIDHDSTMNMFDDMDTIIEDELAASFMGSVTDLVDNWAFTDYSSDLDSSTSLPDDLKDVSIASLRNVDHKMMHFDPTPVTDKVISIDESIKRIATPACTMHNMPATSFVPNKFTAFTANSDSCTDMKKRKSPHHMIPDRECIPGSIVTPSGGEATSSIRVSLDNGDLWAKFNDNTNEMITSAKGRHMFPVLKLSVHCLDPDRLYMVWVHFSCNGSETDQWKWNEKQQKWACKQKVLKKPRSNVGEVAGGKIRSSSRIYDDANLETSSELTPKALSRLSTVIGTRPPDVYNHPASPSPGAFWMHMPINFDKLRLSNKADNTDQVFLESFRKYTPVVYFAPVPDANDKCPAIHRFRLDVASFIAATAYHNKAIAELKILSNPMAKSQLQQLRPDTLEMMTKAATKTDNCTKKSDSKTNLLRTSSTNAAAGNSTPVKSIRSVSLDQPYPTPTSPNTVERAVMAEKFPVRQIWARSLNRDEEGIRTLGVQESPFLHGGVYEVRQQQSLHLGNSRPLIRPQPYTAPNIDFIPTPIQSPIVQTPTGVMEVTVPTYGALLPSRRSSFAGDIYGVSSLDSVFPLFGRDITSTPGSPISAQ